MAEISKLQYAEITDKILGAYYDVYNEMGHGFVESVYSNCMEIVLAEAGLQVQRELMIPVWFRNRDVGKFRADLLVQKLVLIELKAVRTLESSHESQIMNYLRATEVEVGLLFNFGASKPQFKRIVFANENKKIRVYPRKSAVGRA
ncbi:MAG TPA: GxxExxY protein [Candidatus Angelobacter sp.]|jgi:GxxExxY protein|nr:GxxExxY protein [Candidatus Angelobacter sp.]